MVRPSKSFLFDRIEKFLVPVRDGIGLDAGSADFKLRKVFKTDQYFGLDIDLERLKKGMARHASDSKVFGIMADLSRLDSLPDNSFDVIVSANTLYALAPEFRLRAIRHLCRLAAPGGRLLVELSLDESFNSYLQLIKKNFSAVKVIYYRNIISRIYEGIFEREGYLGSHPIAGRRPFRWLAWMLSRSEYLTCHWLRGNRQVFITGQIKDKVRLRNNFNLTRFPLAGERIYNLLTK